MPSPGDMFGVGAGPGAGPMDNAGAMGAPPGGPADPTAAMALGAMDQIGGGSASKALQKVSEGLTLAGKLIDSVLPQVSQTNPKVAKDLYQIAQRIASVKLDIQKEMPVGPPPEMMMQMGGGGGAGMLPPGMAGPGMS